MIGGGVPPPHRAGRHLVTLPGDLMDTGKRCGVRCPRRVGGPTVRYRGLRQQRRETAEKGVVVSVESCPARPPALDGVAHVGDLPQADGLLGL
jgi:hypothetical protein